MAIIEREDAFILPLWHLVVVLFFAVRVLVAVAEADTNCAEREEAMTRPRRTAGAAADLSMISDTDSY